MKKTTTRSEPGRLDKYQERMLLEAYRDGGILREGQDVQLPAGCCLDKRELSPTGILLAHAIWERDALEKQVRSCERMLDSLKFNIEMFDAWRKTWSKKEDG